MIISTKKDLYKNHLNKVNNINFTMREIDVISCIVHVRGGKKIAEMLRIAPKTASVHVHNIMQKLQFNSRDQIIDFIENSGKLPFLKKYYKILLLQNLQNKFISTIKTFVKNQNYHIFFGKDIDEEQREIIELLQSDLQKINIYMICEIDNIDDVIDCTESIDQIDKQNYYVKFMNLIGKVINDDSINKVIDDFTTRYNNICASSEQILSDELSDGSNSTTIFQKKLLTISVISIVLLITLFATFLFNVQKAEMNEEMDYSELNGELEELLKKVTPDCVNTENLKNNFDSIQNVQKIVKIIKRSSFIGHVKNIISSKDFVNILYMINSLANYNLYNNQDWSEARSLLQFNLQLVQTFLNSRGNSRINLEYYAPDEIHAELSIVDGLSEIYVQTIYFLGRTYIYEHDSKSGKKYFQIAEVIGKQLNLFEGYLSARSGIGVILFNDIRDKLSDNYSTIKTKVLIKECIEYYSTLKNDQNAYILNFKPNSLKSKLIIPKDDLYNQLDCIEKILLCYSYLITLTKEKTEQGIYLKNIKQIFKGNQGILDIFKTKQISTKKMATIYNNLGNIFLKFYDQGIDISNFYDDQNDKYKLPLDYIEEIFMNAKNLSRKTYFTKYDSYLGLIETNKRKLILCNNPEVSQEERKKIQSKISEYTKKVNNQV